MDIHGNFSEQQAQVIEQAQHIEGLLTPREMDLLFILGAVKPCEGDVLEIGSYKGRSSVILAKASRMCQDTPIHAVDPLTLPADTDTGDRENLQRDFYRNIEENDCKDNVVFYEMLSGDLISQWDRTLRLLWIDGDHTYWGARNDFDMFSRFLNEGAIVAFHDVLNGHKGPIQVFAHEVVRSPKFGACGIVGSIGWAQYIGDRTNIHLAYKEKLFLQLVTLIPNILKMEKSTIDKLLFKLRRNAIPHAGISVEEFVNAIDVVA
jgi:predicted O-methyltransferase YrrM